jgi:hypothetical protein
MQDVADEADFSIHGDLLIGLYSIHWVNLSMATNTWVNPPGAIVKGPIMSRIQQANNHYGGMVMKL